MHLKLSSGKWHPFCLGLTELSRLLRTCLISLFSLLRTCLITKSIPDCDKVWGPSLSNHRKKTAYQCPYPLKYMLDQISHTIGIDLIQKSQNAPVPYPTMPHSQQKCAHSEQKQTKCSLALIKPSIHTVDYQRLLARLNIIPYWQVIMCFGYYTDVMCASWSSNHQFFDCLFNNMFKLISTNISNFRIVGPLQGEPVVSFTESP